MKTIEVKKVNNQFSVFVNGEKSESGCEKCKHYVDEGDCHMAEDEDGHIRQDDKIYPFCGRVCGYFDIDI